MCLALGIGHGSRDAEEVSHAGDVPGHSHAHHDIVKLVIDGGGEVMGSADRVRASLGQEHEGRGFRVISPGLGGGVEDCRVIGDLTAYRAHSGDVGGNGRMCLALGIGHGIRDAEKVSHAGDVPRHSHALHDIVELVIDGGGEVMGSADRVFACLGEKHQTGDFRVVIGYEVGVDGVVCLNVTELVIPNRTHRFTID